MEYRKHLVEQEVKVSHNEDKLVEIAATVAPDIALLIAYIVKFNIKPDFLLDVINQAYKIALGSGNGKISVVIEDKNVRSVHGIENRWVEKPVLLE